MDVRAILEQRAKVEAFQRKHRIGLLTLLFTDLVGSTKLKQELGDHEAVGLIQRYRGLVREILSRFQEGEEIETAGDSFFIVFAKPSDAVQFSLMVQSKLRALAGEVARPLLNRIGLHIGEVVIEERPDSAKPKDLYGLQIDICARVMSLAQGDQILMTRSAFDNARQVLKGHDIEGVGTLSWLNHGAYVMKGVEEPLEVCEVGEVGAAVLKPPADSEKVHRYVSPDAELVLGWRPAIGQGVPGTSWVLEEKLGEGGFGEVWVGQHTTTKERRVFKFCFRADRVRSLRREMTLFRVLQARVGDHPHIVRLVEVCLERPPFYLEEEYISGRDLRTWCEGEGGVDQMPLEARVQIVAQAAEGLAAAHAAGIIHRDIKPGNILVSNPKSENRIPKEAQNSNPELQHAQPVVKLTDFGIGQVVCEEALAGITRAGFTQTMISDSSSRSGTLFYLAPEMMAGKPASIWSDIYSLGVVLYQLVVGDFTRPVTTDWAKNISDPVLREDLARCLAGEPGERFGSARELAETLKSLPERQRAFKARQEAETARQDAECARGLVRTAAVASFIVMASLTLVLSQFSHYSLTERAIRWQSLTVHVLFLSGFLVGGVCLGTTLQTVWATFMGAFAGGFFALIFGALGIGIQPNDLPRVLTWIALLAPAPFAAACVWAISSRKKTAFLALGITELVMIGMLRFNQPSLANFSDPYNVFSTLRTLSLLTLVSVCVWAVCGQIKPTLTILVCLTVLAAVADLYGYGLLDSVPCLVVAIAAISLMTALAILGPLGAARLMLCAPTPNRNLSLLGAFEQTRKRATQCLTMSGIVLAGLILVVAVFYAGENWRGKRAWQKTEHALIAKGVPLDWSSFVPSPVADAENFYKAPSMSDWFQRGRPRSVEQAPQLPPGLSSIPPIIEELRSWDVFKDHNPNFKVPRDQPDPAAYFLQWFGQYDAQWRKISAACQRPKARMDGDYRLGWGQPVENFVAFRSVAQALVARSEARLIKGERETALQDLITLERLTQCLSARTLVSAMMRVALAGLHAAAIGEGLKEDLWQDPQLEVLQQHLERVDLLPLLSGGLQGERAAILQLLAPKHGWIREQALDLNTPEKALRLLIPHGWPLQNACIYSDLLQAGIEVIDLANRRISPDKCRLFAAEMAKQVSLRTPYNFMAARLVPNWAKACEAAARHQNQVAEALIACALERYRQQTGVYPSSLENLMPQFLRKLPRDVITAQSFKYRLLSSGQFLLYSVGWDEKDDGGDAEKDHVWPYSKPK